LSPNPSTIDHVERILNILISTQAATASMIDAPLWSHELPYRGLIFSFSQIGFRSPYAGSA